MEYKGKLYGKVGGTYLPLQETTADFEKLQKQVQESRQKIIEMKKELKELNKILNDPDLLAEYLGGI